MSTRYSIIIPHYNSEEGLKRLLESIPNEDSIEVIVVDDCSSSECFEFVIEESHLVNIAGYVNSGVKGAGAARNLGLKKSIGEFIIFADADDFFTEKAFSHINNSIKMISENTDILYFGVTSLDSRNGKAGFRDIKISALVNNYIQQIGKYYNEKIRLTHNVPWGKVFRSDFLSSNKIEFDEVLVSNDVMFSAKAGKLASKIACFDKNIYCVTEGEGTLTTKKNLKNFWIRLEIYARYYNFLTKEERKRVSASPLPFLLKNLNYGPIQIYKAILFLIKEKVSIFKNLQIDKYKIKTALREFFNFRF